mgnify:CR=1 FL=1
MIFKKIKQNVLIFVANSASPAICPPEFAPTIPHERSPRSRRLYLIISHIFALVLVSYIRRGFEGLPIRSCSISWPVARGLNGNYAHTFTSHEENPNNGFPSSALMPRTAHHVQYSG